MRRKRIISTLMLLCSLTVFSGNAIIAKADTTETNNTKIKVIDNIAPKSDIKVEQPSIVGKSAITVDYETGEVIYAKDVDTKRYPASVTKMITALIFAENSEKNDEIPYTEEALKQPAESLAENYPGKMLVGDTMNADDLMKTLLLFSANDAATMMADKVSGSEENFAVLMNQKAADLGLTSTHFVTPNGLHDDDHYTTAYDLSILSKAAFHNDWVREVMAEKTATVSLAGKYTLPMENRNKNLGVDGCIGGKTGLTTPAGRCLAAIYERNGRKIIGVVLKSEYGADDTQVFEDMNKIIDWSYEQKRSVYADKGQTIDTVKATYKPFGFFGPEKTAEIPIVLTENVEYYPNTVNNKETTFAIDDIGNNAWKIAKNAENLKVTVNERAYNKVVGAKASITTGELLKANMMTYVIAFVIVVAIIFLITIILRAASTSKRRNSRRRKIF